MTFDRAKFLIERVTDLLSLGLEALMFGDLEEFKDCLRRAVMAATMQQSVIAIRKKKRRRSHYFKSDQKYFRNQTSFA